MNDSFYRDFEERHRGPRELIKSRLGAYVSFIEPLVSLYQPATAVDLGCGRGEWLELVGELGFDACGVDLDDGMLSACRELGLNARKADAIETLQALPDESTALVSAFHLVEHLPFSAVRTLVREALRVLKPGGLLILETPNAENLVVSSSDFYLDPSHERPIPSGLLVFVTEHAGFQRNKVVRLQESAGLPAGSRDGLLGVLYGVSSDYSIVAQKNASAGVLSRFDKPFNADYGTSLEALALRYDQQAENRASHIEDQLTQAETRTAQLANQMETRTAQLANQMETRTAQVVAQMDARMTQVVAQMDARMTQVAAQIDAHMAQLAAQTDAHTAQVVAQMDARMTQVAAQMDARMAQITAQLHLILNSRSWRITAPLRLAGHILHRFRTAARDGRLISGSKRRIQPLLQRLGQFVLRRPRLKKAALWTLDHLPAVKHRLRSASPQPVNVAASHLPPVAQQASELSPRAARIYAGLKKAIVSRKN